MFQRYATFLCSGCAHRFADQLPPLSEDLPRCPLCGGLSQLLVLLADIAETWGVLRVNE